MNPDELKAKVRELMGDIPIASFAFRRPATLEESKLWEAEGVIVNPASLDDVIEAAKQRAASKPPRAPEPKRS